MSEIKWEVGKKYRTENGTWAICAAIIGPHPTSGDVWFPIFMHHEDGTTNGHTIDGRWVNNGSEPRDIVGEWVEPREFVRDVLLLEYVHFPGQYLFATDTTGRYKRGDVGKWNNGDCRVTDIQTVTLKHTPEAT